MRGKFLVFCSLTIFAFHRKMDALSSEALFKSSCCWQLTSPMGLDDFTLPVHIQRMWAIIKESAHFSRVPRVPRVSGPSWAYRLEAWQVWYQQKHEFCTEIHATSLEPSASQLPIAALRVHKVSLLSPFTRLQHKTQLKQPKSHCFRIKIPL